MKIKTLTGTHNKPLWVDILLVILGVLGVMIFVIFRQQALPDAAINLQYSRSQISEMVKGRLNGLGFSASDYEFVLSFAEDSMPSYFLQQNLGIEMANKKIVEESLPIYSWEARWFRPLQKEEFFSLSFPYRPTCGIQSHYPRGYPWHESLTSRSSTSGRGFPEHQHILA